jgi:hypothetical protein
MFARTQHLQNLIKSTLTPGFKPIYFNSKEDWYHALMYSTINEYEQ